MLFFSKFCSIKSFEMTQSSFIVVRGAITSWLLSFQLTIVPLVYERAIVFIDGASEGNDGSRLLEHLLCLDQHFILLHDFTNIDWCLLLLEGAIELLHHLVMLPAWSLVFISCPCVWEVEVGCRATIDINCGEHWVLSHLVFIRLFAICRTIELLLIRLESESGLVLLRVSDSFGLGPGLFWGWGGLLLFKLLNFLALLDGMGNIMQVKLVFFLFRCNGFGDLRHEIWICNLLLNTLILPTTKPSRRAFHRLRSLVHVVPMDRCNLGLGLCSCRMNLLLLAKVVVWESLEATIFQVVLDRHPIVLLAVFLRFICFHMSSLYMRLLSIPWRALWNLVIFRKCIASRTHWAHGMLRDPIPIDGSLALDTCSHFTSCDHFSLWGTILWIHLDLAIVAHATVSTARSFAFRPRQSLHKMSTSLVLAIGP